MYLDYLIYIECKTKQGMHEQPGKPTLYNIVAKISVGNCRKSFLDSKSRDSRKCGSRNSRDKSSLLALTIGEEGKKNGMAVAEKKNNIGAALQ